MLLQDTQSFLQDRTGRSRGAGLIGPPRVPGAHIDGQWDTRSLRAEGLEALIGAALRGVAPSAVPRRHCDVACATLFLARTK